MAKSILIIDSVQDVRESLQMLLSNTFSVRVASCEEDGWASAKNEKPDLILEDLNPPGIGAIELCKRIRRDEELRATPIIVMSGSNDEDVRTESFLWGADDFLIKPFTGRELMARVLSKLAWHRQPVAQGCPHLKLGNLTIDSARHEILVGERKVKLSQYELKLLTYFAANPGRVLSREEIMNAVWSGCIVSERTIDTHVYFLRKKISGCDHQLATIHGSGYSLQPQ